MSTDFNTNTTKINGSLKLTVANAPLDIRTVVETEADIPLELRLNVDNNNYFLTASPRAIAMSKLLMEVLNED